jgi:uncharacterized protein (TIRG00374 family)
VSAGQRWRLLGGGLVAALLLFLFFRGVDWTGLLRALRGASRLYLAGVVFASGLTYLARAWRWGYLLSPLARVPFPRLFSATMVGFLSGLLVPRAGEIVRPYLVARRHGIPTSAGVATIILERLVDLITVLVLFALYLYVLPIPGAQSRGPLLGFLKMAGIATGLGVVVIIAVLLAFHVHADRALAVIDRLLLRFPAWVAAWLSQVLRAFGQGLAVLQAPASHLLAIQAQSFLIWLLIALGFYWNNAAFGITLPFHSTFLLIAFLTVGVAIPTPGMVGGFHAFYLLAMTEAFGVSKDAAAAAALSAHALSNLPVLVLGLLLLGREGLSFGKVAEMTEEGRGKGGEEEPEATSPPRGGLGRNRDDIDGRAAATSSTAPRSEGGGAARRV